MRPFLGITRAEIVDYAHAHDLRWIEDSSNAQESHDRNYWRHVVMPLVRARWPAASARVAHAVSLQRDAAGSLDAAADALLDAALGSDDRRLAVAAVQALDVRMQRWVLRRWIKRAGFALPDAVHLEALQAALSAPIDAQPCVRWKSVEARRYRGLLHLGPVQVRAVDNTHYRWQCEQRLSLPYGVLSATPVHGSGLSAAALATGDLSVRFRRGGERCHPQEREHSQSLKRLFQEWHVPPWQRYTVPLIYIGDDLAAVADICICKPFVADIDEAGWRIFWQTYDQVP
jgi:tRNA(Ile)-lysidine synthase